MKNVLLNVVPPEARCFCFETFCVLCVDAGVAGWAPGAAAAAAAGPGAGGGGRGQGGGAVEPPLRGLWCALLQSVCLIVSSRLTAYIIIIKYDVLKIICNN